MKEDDEEKEDDDDDVVAVVLLLVTLGKFLCSFKTTHISYYAWLSSRRIIIITPQPQHYLTIPMVIFFGEDLNLCVNYSFHIFLSLSLSHGNETGCNLVVIFIIPTTKLKLLYLSCGIRALLFARKSRGEL